MAKKKLQRFAEIPKFNNVVQAGVDEVLNNEHRLCGKWGEFFFCSPNPIVIELGCGKGEYTVGLANLFPERNFLGVDIKGSRIWSGARHAYENKMQNVGFLRTRIEMISSFFEREEIDQIWLTFPDPQLKKARKRLTSPAFLNRYRRFLRSGGPVHLKTDSLELHNYTLSVIRANGLELLEATTDLYSSVHAREENSIKTYYETRYLEQGKSICYLKFKVDCLKEIEDPDEN